MKIAINTLSVRPRVSLSAYVYVVNMLEALQRIDRENEYVVVMGSWNVASFNLWAENFRGYVFPWKLGPLGRVVVEQMILPFLLLRQKVDLFYAIQGNSLPPLLPCPAVLNIAHLQSFSSPESLSRFKRQYYNMALRSAVSRARRIICFSQSSRREIVQYLGIPEDRIAVVYPGVSQVFMEAQGPPPVSALEAIGVKQPYILGMGNMLPHKNLPRLVEAFQLLKKRREIPHRLVIAGVERTPQFLVSAMTRLPLDVRKLIILPGYLDDRLLSWVYRLADVFVYPSYCEAFGMPLLEAMACGVPIVTSDLQAMPEVANGAARLVNPFDVEDLTRGIMEALTDAELRGKLIALGRKRVQEFSWEGAARATLQAFQGAIGS